MLVIHQDALLEVLHRVLVVANFEVSKAKIILQLIIIVIYPLSFLKGCDSKNVLTLLVHGYAVVEESFPTARMVLLKVLLRSDGKSLPIFRVQ